MGEVNQSQPKKILVVDDRYEEVEALLIHLKRQGWQVDYVSSGEDALKHVEASPPDLIISDWDMPGMTGYEFMGNVAEKPTYRDIPFLLAHYDWPIGIWSKPTPNGRTADSHIMKPFNGKELSCFIGRVFQALEGD